MKHTLALISTSRAYRLPSVAVAEPEKRGPFRFRGPLARRMTAEQFADAVSALTGEWPQVSKDMLEVDDRGQGGQVAAVRAIVGEAAGEPVRAALAFDDSLLAALGRTSREQVVTRRDSVATTLQALEFINGATLDHRLQQGARRWVEWHGNDPEVLIHRLFLEALGRAPGPRELAAARELIGTPVTAEGVQDLLWAVIMLPEFQWID